MFLVEPKKAISRVGEWKQTVPDSAQRLERLNQLRFGISAANRSSRPPTKAFTRQPKLPSAHRSGAFASPADGRMHPPHPSPPEPEPPAPPERSERRGSLHL